MHTDLINRHTSLHRQAVHVFKRLPIPPPNQIKKGQTESDRVATTIQYRPFHHLDYHMDGDFSSKTKVDHGLIIMEQNLQFSQHQLLRKILCKVYVIQLRDEYRKRKNQQCTRYNGNHNFIKFPIIS